MTTHKRIRRIIDYVVENMYRFGDSNGDWLSDPDRMARCDDAASDGADGSTHAEVIKDMRNACDDYLRARYNWNGHDRIQAAIDCYFDDLEAWHATNGTLDQEIG